MLFYFPFLRLAPAAATEAETGAEGSRRGGAVAAGGLGFLGTASGLKRWRNREDDVAAAESAVNK